MAPTRPCTRNIRFEVLDGHLVRTVSFPAAPERDYVQRCDQATFTTVAHAVEEHGRHGFTGEDLANAENLPYTQVYVALGFLMRHELIERPKGRGRRFVAAEGYSYEDAMIEFHYLAAAPY